MKAPAQFVTVARSTMRPNSQKSKKKKIQKSKIVTVDWLCMRCTARLHVVLRWLGGLILYVLIGPLITN